MEEEGVRGGGSCSVYKRGAVYWCEKPMYKEGTRRGRELPGYSTVEGVGGLLTGRGQEGVSGTSLDFPNGPQDSAHREEGRAG